MNQTICLAGNHPPLTVSSNKNCQYGTVMPILYIPHKFWQFATPLGYELPAIGFEIEELLDLDRRQTTRKLRVELTDY
jgi:hypothetical protein